MNIILFGQLAEITGSNNIVVSEISNTDELQKKISQLYPAMTGVKYVIAVDKNVINSNTVISENNDVALLPPFSGG